MTMLDDIRVLWPARRVELRGAGIQQLPPRAQGSTCQHRRGALQKEERSPARGKAVWPLRGFWCAALCAYLVSKFEPARCREEGDRCL